MKVRDCVCVGLFVAVVPFAVNANIYTVGPGGGFAGCTHATLQAAVNAAAANPGPDEIRIAMGSSGYTNQAVVVNAQDVSILGGFADCLPLAPTGRTRLSGAGGIGAPVLKIQSTTGTPVHVDLERLELVDGDNVAQFARGGGLRVEALGEVRVTNARIAGNHAFYGAGISITGDLGDDATRLLIGDDVQIEDNSTVGQGSSGGGIDVQNAYVRIGGTSTVIRRNVVRGVGGGLYVRGASATEAASVDIESGGQGDDAIVSHNQADGSGGGVWASTFATVRAYTTDPSRPVAFDDNQSIGSYGGAIHAQTPTATVTLWETIVSDNYAQQGGAALLADDGAQIAALPATDADAPPGTVACPAGDRCNLFVGNHSILEGGIALVGNLDATATTRVRLDSAVIVGNAASSLFADRCLLPSQPELCGKPASIAVTNSRIAPNADASWVVHVQRAAAFSCDLCTVAGSRDAVAAPLFETNGVLALSRSIVFQPTRAVVGGPPASLQASALLLHDASGFPAQADIRVGDPRFVAPGAGDFRVAVNSPALDSAGMADAPAFDLDGHARVVDQPGVANRAGPLDLGAYERAADADVIFVYGFD